MKSFKQQCVDLRKKDYTLNEIVEITGRSKTSVYFHIKNIPLSTKKKDLVKTARTKQAVAIAISRRGKACRPFKSFSVWSPETVLLLSHFIFDGEILKKRCRYHNRSKILINRVEKLMFNVYDYSAKKSFDRKSGVSTISYYNIELQIYLYCKAAELLVSINSLTNSHKKEFLRAFFDDEGCMDYRPKRNVRQIRGYQNNKKILETVKQLLFSFNIESKLQGVNEVVISGKENLKRFQKEINFSEGVRLNPNRTNSLWKKDIEKRELLAMAIKSYKT